MATEALKTTPITNMDATPPVRTTSGRGGPGILRYDDGTLTVTTAKDTGSTYRMVRIPSNAIVKQVWACLDTAVTTFTADIGVYYASGGAIPQGITAGAVIDADLFGSAVALASVVVPTQYTMESTEYAVAEVFQPLWQAAGLSSDPDCMFDIVLTATATTDGAAVPYLAVMYVVPGA